MIIETIKNRDPSRNHGRMICVDCLDLFCSEYVEDTVKKKVGEITQLDQEEVDSMKERKTFTENLNLAFEKSTTVGQRTADQVASSASSWTFIGAFAAVLAVWISFNSLGVIFRPFVRYPYILLNLPLSCLAAIQAPIIKMSQNAMEARDRLRSENNYQVNLKAELEIRHLHAKLDGLLKHQRQKLVEHQQIQMNFIKELVRRDQNDKSVK